MNKKIAMYLRLSRDDGEEQESNSISSQREIIKNYAKQHGLKIDCEYVDDGISGATFNRPSFKKMMADLEKGKINTIVVKDLSRFGRDYIEAGKYIQKIFPEKKVRFISINDNYDSIKADTNDTHLILPIKNFINDSYCRDISMKVKSSLNTKREKGEFIGSFAPFGYLKNPSNKYELIIDYDVKPIIETIFNKKVDGYSSNAIAKYLNEVGALTPAYRKEQLHGECLGFVAKGKKWNSKMINRIISNKVYVGTLEQGKQVKLNYKSDKRINVREEDWFVIHDAHKSIISSSVFEIANEMMLRDLASRGIPSLFSGMLFCSDCGSQLIKRTLSYKGKKTVHYICGHYNSCGECSRHSIKEEELSKVIWHMLNDFLSYSERIHRKALTQDLSKIDFNVEVDDLLNEKKKYEMLRQSLFMDLEDDLINEDEFNRYRTRYAKQIKEVSNQIKTKQERMQKLKEKILNKQWLVDMEELKETKSLTRKHLVYLVKKIKVAENKKINIEFNNMKELDVLEELLRKAIETKKKIENKRVLFPLAKDIKAEVAYYG